MGLIPRSLLYDASGNPIDVADGTAIPAGTGGFLGYGSDAGTARRFLVDPSGRQLVAGAGANAAAIAGNPVRIAGSDGTLTRDILTDTVGRQIVVGIGASGAPVGGLVSVQVPNTTATATMGSLNAATTIAMAGVAGAGMVLAAGTLIGTIVAEISMDGGTTWISAYFRDPTTGQKVTSIVFASANTVTTRAIVCAGGVSNVRVRVSAYTSGTASCSVSGGIIATVHDLFAGTAGVAVPPTVTQVGGVDSGGLLRAIAVDSNGVGIEDTFPAAITRGLIANAVVGSRQGVITTTSITEVPVRVTGYTEQASGAQRSVSSTSANDTSAGTGARTVRLTYYVQSGNGTMTGPFTETITMNGTTVVNTAATDIRYIEKMEVLTAGSSVNNAGIIQLFAATAGAGGVIASIGSFQRQTYYAHHYVPTGKTCYMTDHYQCSTAASGNTPNFGSRALDLGTANAIETILADSIYSGGSASAIQIFYPVPRKVVGPARILMYVSPTTTTSQTSSAAFSFYEL